MQVTSHRVLAVVSVLAAAWLGRAQVISTVAGTEYTFPRRALPALQAPLGSISGVLLDPSGNAYVSDVNNNIILKLTPSGSTTIFAGIGISGYSGDGGPATLAALSGARGMAIDNAGNIYIADEGNNRVRMVDVNGIMSTVAGNGRKGFSGDGGLAIAASLATPTEVAIDTQGNLYISDEYNHRIRRVNSSDGLIRTVAGNGQPTFGGDGGLATNASLQYPRGVAFDSKGNLYISDQYNQRIRRVDQSGVISTVAGNGQGGRMGDGGPATQATLLFPAEIAFDSNGNLYIAEKENHVVRQVSPTGVISTFAGTGAFSFSGDGGPANSATLFHPQGVAVDGGNNIYIADSDNNRLRRVTTNRIITTIAGTGANRLSGDGGVPTSAVLNTPYAIAFDNSDGLLFADSNASVVRRIVIDKSIATVAGTGTTGTSGDGGTATHATFIRPQGIAVDRSGNVFVSDQLGQTIRRIGTDGNITLYAGQPGRYGFSQNGTALASSVFDSPLGSAFDSNGVLFVADRENNVIRKLTAGGVVTVAGNGNRGFSGDGSSALQASFSAPSAIAFDASGSLYIADTGNNRIRRVDSSNVITTVAGDGAAGYHGDGGPATTAELNQPAGLAFSGAALFIADTNNHVVRRIMGGSISTVAGDGKPGFAGDGDVATNASLLSPTAVLVDSSGNLFIADSGNHRIREVLASVASFSASPSALTFNTSSGGTAPPAQTNHLLSTVANLSFSAQASDSWLSVQPTNGLTPTDIQIAVDPTALGPGITTGQVTITTPNARPSTQTVSVTVNVANPIPAKLTVGNSNLSFALQQGNLPVTAQISVSNPGSGTLAFSAAASTTDGAAWLAVSPGAGSVGAGSPVSLTVTVSPGALTSGTYVGNVVVNSSTTGEQYTVPITLALSPPKGQLVLSPVGLTFIAVQGGGAVLPQSIGILNTGSGQLSFQADATTISSSGWLTVSGASGSLNRPYLDVAFVNVAVDATRLAQGDYYGQVTISSAGAVNSPQSVAVILKVLAPGSNPGPEVRPTGLVFTGIQGGQSPGAQTVALANTTGVQLDFGSNIAYVTAGNYLKSTPPNASISAQTPVQVVVAPDFSQAVSGDPQRAVLTFAFSDGTARTVSILSVVAPAAQRTGATGRAQPFDVTTGCQPTKLIPTFTLLSSGASVSAGFPATIQTRIVNDCGLAMTTGAVTATFSNGDPALPLVNLQSGNWTASWAPGTRNLGGVTITVRANQADAGLTGTASFSQNVQAATSAPMLSGAPRSAVSLTDGPVAPGDLFLIQGAGLADGQQAGSLPLNTQLGGASVLLGGRLAPLLYADSSHVVGLVPMDVPTNAAQQLALQHNGTLALPVSVIVSPARPTIFSKDQSGNGQGLIYGTDGITIGALSDQSNPAKPGDMVVLYCAGLGLVDNQGNAVNSVSVNIGGQTATVTYAGTAIQTASDGGPMLLGNTVSPASGLYQVNAVIPPNIPDGIVPVTVNSGSLSSQAGITMYASNPGSPQN